MKIIHVWDQGELIASVPSSAELAEVWADKIRQAGGEFIEVQIQDADTPDGVLELLGQEEEEE